MKTSYLVSACFALLLNTFSLVSHAQTPVYGAQQVAAGSGHTCAITETGGVKCWGANYYGALGDGTYTARPTPVDVVGLSSGVTAIAAGNFHTCALNAAGGVKCWGRNIERQLGDGTATNRATPVDVASLNSGVTAIALGSDDSCALTATGGVKCWGWNVFGQLGDSTTTNRSMPVDVTGLNTGVAGIAAGHYHTCAVTTARGVKCWGYNGGGGLGDGTLTNRSKPVDVAGLSSGVAAIAAGDGHTCALMVKGGIKCWGYNPDGQLGDGSTLNRGTPVDVTGLGDGVTAIAAGDEHTCALTVVGGLKCWGRNAFGQLGDSTTINRTTAVNVAGLSIGVAAIAAGLYRTCALTTAGGVKCCGYNELGQLGDGSTANSVTPVTAIAPTSGALLTSSQNPARTNQSVTYTLRVSGNSPTGLVAFKANGVPIASCTALPLASGSASCATSFATVGSRIITATYSGDASNSPSLGALAAGQTVLPAMLSITPSPSQILEGQRHELILAIDGNNPGGTITWTTDPASAIAQNCSPLPVVAGRAVIPSACVPKVRLGQPLNITVNYSGDANNAASAAAIRLEATGLLQELTLAANLTNPRANSPIVLTALARGVGPNGVVYFFASATNGTTSTTTVPLAGCTNIATSSVSQDVNAAVAYCNTAAVAGVTRYSVDYYQTAGGVLGTVSITTNSPTLGPLDYNDIWWAGDAEAGWGMHITQKGLQQFNAFYVYDASGKPIWYVMSGGTWNADFTRFTGPIYQPRGSLFSVYDVSKWQPGASVGTGTLTFASNNSASFDYTISGVTARKSLSRFAYAVPDDQPRITVKDLWWGGDAENGWGVAIAQRDKSVFASWYTYDANGNTTWFVLPGCLWVGTTCEGQLFSTTGSPWLGTNFNSALFRSQLVGSMSLDFRDQDSATMTYNVNGVTQTKGIRRFGF